MVYDNGKKLEVNVKDYATSENCSRKYTLALKMASILVAIGLLSQNVAQVGAMRLQ